MGYRPARRNSTPARSPARGTRHQRRSGEVRLSESPRRSAAASVRDDLRSEGTRARREGCAVRRRGALRGRGALRDAAARPYATAGARSNGDELCYGRTIRRNKVLLLRRPAPERCRAAYIAALYSGSIVRGMRSRRARLSAQAWRRAQGNFSSPRASRSGVIPRGRRPRPSPAWPSTRRSSSARSGSGPSFVAAWALPAPPQCTAHSFFYRSSALRLG